MVSLRDCSDAVLAGVVAPRALEAGALYRRQGRVRNLKIEDGGARISAEVQGNEKKPYRQTISIFTDKAGKPSVDGHCSCPVGFNCKHVAAAILEARDGVHAGAGSSTPEAAKRDAAMALVDSTFAKNRPKMAGPPGQVARVAQAPVATPQPPAEKPLPYEVQSWLDALAAASSDDAYPPDVRNRILYILAPADDMPKQAPRLTRPLAMHMVKVTYRKDGTFGNDARPFDFGSLSYTYGNRPKFVREADNDISDRLRLLTTSYRSQRIYLFDTSAAAEVLTALLATGRTRWLSVAGPVLTPGPTLAGEIVWRLGPDGRLQTAIELAPGEGEDANGDRIVFAAFPPVWVDPKAGLLGQIETGLRPQLALAALAAPPIAPKQAMQVATALGTKLPKVAQLAPPVPEAGRLVQAVPRPRLRLEAAGPAAIGIGRLSFLYEDIEIVPEQIGARPTLIRGGAAVTIVRDRRAEAAAAARLDALDLVDAAPLLPALRLAEGAAFAPADGDLGWLDFLWRDREALEEEGWTIEIAQSFPLRLEVPEGGMEAEVREGSGIDWLELDLGVTLGGTRIDLVPALVAFILSPDFSQTLDLGDGDPEAPMYLPLGDGRVLALPQERMRPILEVLASLVLHQGEGRPRLTPADAAALDALEQAGVVFTGGEKLRALGRMLSEAGGIPDVAPPPWFTAELRPYQRLGLSWLQLLGNAGLGAILADDMGLGKTVQTLAHIAVEKASGRLDRPALIIAPTSLVGNWTREARRFAPELNVLVLHGLDRHKSFGDIAKSDIVITTYPLIPRDGEMLESREWHLIVLDEAQAIKNPRSAISQILKRFSARQRLCLSGTPMENHLGELWSLFDFASPGFLGGAKTFNQVYRNPIEKKGEGDRAGLLARRVRPFMLRRTKEEVAKDLPPKNEMTEPIELGEAQRDVYETIRATMHEKVRTAIAAKGLSKSHIIILDALLKLRQAVCDPRLLKGRSAALNAAGSAKLDRLAEMLRELVDEGRRILVFSQFTSMLALIEKRLQADGIDYCLLTGETDDRPSVIARFQDGDVPVFLVSLKAGGVGLNLTAADTVILYDPWWNPAVEDQAVDRAHRIGQTKPVFVHRLVALGTIEEKMEILKERKRALADGLFDADGKPTLAMTPDDIEELFS